MDTQRAEWTQPKTVHVKSVGKTATSCIQLYNKYLYW